MMTTHEDHAASGPQPVSALHTVIASLSALFPAGACAGGVAAVVEKGLTSRRAAILAALIALTAAAVWWALRTARRALQAGEPVAPRIRTARRIVALSVILGILTGFAFGMLDVLDIIREPAAPNGTIPPSGAILLIALCAVMVPLTWVWYRSIDEFEARAYNDGASAALHAFSFAAPVWWLAARAGLAAEPDGVTIFFGTMIVWGAVWLWRRPR